MASWVGSQSETADRERPHEYLRGSVIYLRGGLVAIWRVVVEIWRQDGRAHGTGADGAARQVRSGAVTHAGYVLTMFIGG